MKCTIVIDDWAFEIKLLLGRRINGGPVGGPFDAVATLPQVFRKLCVEGMLVRPDGTVDNEFSKKDFKTFHKLAKHLGLTVEYERKK